MSFDRPPRRIVQADAIEWMATEQAESDASIITSLPDVTELPLGLDAWRAWFIDAARRVIRFTPDEGVAIFYQSDIRSGRVWIDKGYLVMRAAEEERAPIWWHKIVCRHPPGTASLGRPTYSHMICVGRKPPPLVRRPGPDVLPDAGLAPWGRAMAVEACRVACRFLLDETKTRLVIDPFCGRGTVLALANEMGLDALGVDISAKRCRAARSLRLDASEQGQRRK
jgi:hypothetical protein